MAFATHLIKVNGEFETKLWDEKTLRKYVDSKIIEIEDVLHPDLELFNIKENKIEVWLFLKALPSEVTQEIVDKWAKDHIIEEGLKVNCIEIKILHDLTKPFDDNKMYVRIK